MEVKENFIWMIVTGLFVFLLFNAVASFQYGNNVDANSSLGSDPALNSTYNQIYGNLSSLQETSEEQKDASQKDVSTTGESIFTFSFSSMFSFGKTFLGVFTDLVNSISSIIQQYSGLNPGASKIISGVIYSVFIISILIGLWSLYKWGR